MERWIIRGKLDDKVWCELSVSPGGSFTEKSVSGKKWFPDDATIDDVAEEYDRNMYYELVRI